jgi:ribosome-associated toxin RatA of RatAB toxin-antitoxin module
MRSVHKSVLVPYSAQQMFDLVERVEDYPKFLPWCAGARILQQTTEETLARIDIDYHGVRTHFTTANRNQPPDRIVISLRDGPFRRLDGTWQFRGLSDSACKVEFELNYEFATPVLEGLIGPVFGRIADSFIEAFVKRAVAVHGGAA